MAKRSACNKAMAIFLSFWANFIYVGMFCSFAEFFDTLVTSFDSSYAFFGFVGTSVAAMSKFSGSLPQAAVERFTYPVVMMALGVLLWFVFFLTSFDIYAWEFVVTYSMLFGIVAGFLMQTTYTIVYDAFEKDEVGWALGIATAGAGLGYAVFSCLAGYYVVVNQILSWREMFRIFGYCGLSISGAGVLAYFFLEKNIENRYTGYTEVPEKEMADLSEGESLVPAPAPQKFGWELLFACDPTAWKLFISNFLLFLIDLVPIKFSLIYAYSVTGNIYVYYYVPIAMGTGTIVMRIVLSSMAGKFSAQRTNELINGALIVVCIILAYSTNIVVIVFFLSLYSGLNSSLYPVMVLRCTEIMGSYQYARNLSVQYYAVGFATLCGGYLGGTVYDATDGSMMWVFLMCAGIFSASLLFDIVVFCDRKG